MAAELRVIAVAAREFAQLSKGVRSFVIVRDGEAEARPFSVRETVVLEETDEQWARPTGRRSRRNIVDWETRRPLIVLSLGFELDASARDSRPIYGFRDSAGKRVRLPLILPTDEGGLRCLLGEIEACISQMQSQIKRFAVPGVGYMGDHADWLRRVNTAIESAQRDAELVASVLHRRALDARTEASQ